MLGGFFSPAVAAIELSMKSSLQFLVERKSGLQGRIFHTVIKSGEDTEEIVNSILVKQKPSD